MHRLSSFVAVVSAAFLSACTGASTFTDGSGRQGIAIICGASLPMAVCHDRAVSVCGGAYDTIEERRSFNRKELRVVCQRSGVP